MKDPVISVIGLGYVGLPLALAFSESYQGVMGFDRDVRRVAELKAGIDRTRESEAEILSATRLRITSNKEDLRACNVHVVAVPTPIDRWNKPDLGPVISATETVASIGALNSQVQHSSERMDAWETTTHI